jgi:RNA polymerase sigma factor (sigma-70 family)
MTCESTAPIQGRPERRSAQKRDAIVAAVRDELPVLLGVARRWSLCHDDADDALQRALEIMMRRVDRIDPALAARWLTTVVKHEAMAVRSARMRAIDVAGTALDRHEATSLPSPHEQLETSERLGSALQALSRLKPHERRALVLQAEGLSYREIAQRESWTYTKVNRALTEGRAAFRRCYDELEACA